MSDAEEFMQRTMRDAMATATIQQIVNAYDQYAVSAIIGLLREGNLSAPAATFAEKAWEIADAMMAERKKRGLGGMP